MDTIALSAASGHALVVRLLIDAGAKVTAKSSVRLRSTDSNNLVSNNQESANLQRATAVDRDKCFSGRTGRMDAAALGCERRA